MRGLPARRIASSALCAALLLAVTGPVAAAAERDSAVERVEEASRAPVPDADALADQVKTLADLGGVLTPLTELMNTVLKADTGQISAEQASKLEEALKEALAKISAAAPASPVTPPAATTPTTPSTTTPSTTTPSTTTPSTTTPSTTTPSTTTPSDTAPATTLPALPTLTQSGVDSEATSVVAPGDLVEDAFEALEVSIDALIEAAMSGDATKVGPAISGVVTGAVNAVAAMLVDSGLPAPTLEGLPALPALPASPTDSLPASSVSISQQLPTS
jgi:hypothetical protein